MMCGGASEEKDITDEVRTICENVNENELIGLQIKAAVEAKANMKYEMFQPLKFKSQVVAGTNYFIKIQVASEGKFIHVRIYEPLPYTNESPQVHGLLQDKGADDPLDYFDQN